jgi:hypothetical protein
LRDCLRVWTALQWHMPELTRRRYPERHECWHVYYGDVQVGTIARRAGVPFDADQWEWSCGFYPGSDPGEYLIGTAATFDEARADFDVAWRIFSARRTEADYKARRDDRDWHARKRAMWEAGELLPSQKPNTMMRCPCGDRFDSHDPAGSYVHRQHIYEAQASEIHR